MHANELVEAGAYEWFDTNGLRHLGFISKGKLGLLSGTFVREDGESRAIVIDYGDGTYCHGEFFGPLPIEKP